MRVDRPVPRIFQGGWNIGFMHSVSVEKGSEYVGLLLWQTDPFASIVATSVTWIVRIWAHDFRSENLSSDLSL